MPPLPVVRSRQVFAAFGCILGHAGCGNLGTAVARVCKSTAHTAQSTVSPPLGALSGAGARLCAESAPDPGHTFQTNRQVGRGIQKRRVAVLRCRGSF